MTKKNPINITLVLILVVALCAVLFLAPRFLAQAELTIDSDWWIVHNHNDQCDVVTAKALQSEYGSLMVWIETAEDENLNAEGQNLLFIGGSETFAGKVPWFETWPTLSVLEPSGQPDVYMANDETWSNWWIHTPILDYDIMVDGEFLHDFGVVTKAYDLVLERWIIIVVGWSAECTYAGAKLLIEDFELVKLHSWIVYELTEQGATDPTTWTLNQFSYEIIDSG